MVCSENDDDVVAPDAIGKTFQEPREIVVETQHLIVNLARVRAERVSDGVGRRQAHRENVSALAAQS